MSNKIVGRAQEQKVLADSLHSHRSELIAVYGRRRIGKTYLIRGFFGTKIVFSFTGLSEGSKTTQIKNFILKLNEVTDDFKNAKPPTDWLEAFSCLKTFIKGIKKSKKKKVIFIDEFPWAASHKSGFLPAFENFWNDYCTTRSDLVVIVCGSAAAYMVKKIIRNRKGLHNRISHKIKLKPFNLNETKAFLKYKGIELEEYELLKLYMTLGGVAEYLEHVKKGESAVVTIDRLCFQDGAHLKDEFEEVFKSLFNENSFHTRIMDTLAENRKRGLTREELLKASNIESSGRFSGSLMELIESGFVLKYDAYQNNTKTTLFRIYDEFCLFHLQFMKPFKGSSWQQLFQKPAYESWCGYSFETICLKHNKEIKKALRIDQIQSKSYTWNNSKAQVDMVIDRADNWVDLCEMKFCNDEFTIDADCSNKLRNRVSQFKSATKTKKGVYLTMVTTWGTKPGKYSSIITNDLKMEVLFEEL